jgi:glycosyltransferase involved in cell wall biosynthesis
MHAGGFYKKIDRWIAISNFMRSTFINAGIPENKIVTLRHSAKIDPVSPCISDQGYYLFLGRLISAKGVLTLLDAWDQITNKLGASTPVLKIAGEGELAQQVEAYSSQNRKVEFLGRIDGLTKTTCIQNCRAMIAPSLWWEPLGIVTYEAYNACKPMLAARSGGLAETVKHGQTGFLHDPGDVRQLVSQVESLEADPAKAQNLGNAGREWLSKNSNDAQWLDNFDQILQNLLEK